MAQSAAPITGAMLAEGVEGPDHLLPSIQDLLSPVDHLAGELVRAAGLDLTGLAGLGGGAEAGVDHGRRHNKNKNEANDGLRSNTTQIASLHG